MFLNLIDSGRAGIIRQWNAMDAEGRNNSVNKVVFEAAAASEFATGNINLQTGLLQYNSVGLLNDIGTLYRENNVSGYNAVDAAKMADTFNESDPTEKTIRSLFLLRAGEGIQNAIRGNNQIGTGELYKKKYGSSLFGGMSMTRIEERTIAVHDLLYNSGLSESTTNYLEASAFSALTEEVVGGGDGYQGKYKGLSNEVKMENADGTITTYKAGDKRVELRLFDSYTITEKVKLLGMTIGKKYKFGVADGGDSWLLEQIISNRNQRYLKSLNQTADTSKINVKTQQGGGVLGEGLYDVDYLEEYNTAVKSLSDVPNLSSFRSAHGSLTRETGVTSISFKGLFAALGQMVGGWFGNEEEGRSIGSQIGNIFAPIDLGAEILQGVTNALGITQNAGNMDFSDWSKGNPLKQIGYGITNMAVDFLSGVAFLARPIAMIVAAGFAATGNFAMAFLINEGGKALSSLASKTNELLTKSASDKALAAYNKTAEMFTFDGSKAWKEQFSSDRWKDDDGGTDWLAIASDVMYAVGAADTHFNGLSAAQTAAQDALNSASGFWNTAIEAGKIGITSVGSGIANLGSNLQDLGSNLLNFDYGSFETLTNVVGQLDTTGAVKALHDTFDYFNNTQRVINGVQGTISGLSVIKSVATSALNIASLHAEKGSFSEAFENSFTGNNLFQKAYNFADALDKGAIISEEYENTETGETVWSTESGQNGLLNLYTNVNPVKTKSIDYDVQALPGSDGFVNNYKAPSLASATSGSTTKKKLGAVNQARYNWSKDYKALDLGKVLGVA
jgi:hypothetical protein